MKRLISMFTLICMIMTIGCFSASAGDETSGEELSTLENEYPYDLDEETYEAIQRQNPARNAHREFMSHLEKDIDGDVIYPDTFAGCYINNETYCLCIALIDCSEKNTSEYDKYFSDPSVVQYIPAEYSYNYLSDIQEEIKSNLENVRTICIDQEQNVVKVGVDNPSLLKDRTGREVQFSNEYPVQIHFSEGTKTCADELWGGDGVAGLTIGACGTYNGDDAILLSGHDLSVGGQIVYNNKKIATIKKVQYKNNRDYDYSVAVIDSGADVRMSNKVYNQTNYTTITSGLQDDPVRGEIICRYGKNSGFATYYVDDVDVTVCSNVGTAKATYIGGLVACSLRSGKESQNGDSGGPFYLGHEFYGVLHGRSSTQTYYSPFKGVTSNFDLW